MNSPIDEAINLQNEASEQGLDWKTLPPVFDKVLEETQELKEAYNRNNQEEICDELGDLIFQCLCLCRHLKCDFNDCLKNASKKFQKRFHLVKSLAKSQNLILKETPLDQIEELWNLAKKMSSSSKGSKLRMLSEK